MRSRIQMLVLTATVGVVALGWSVPAAAQMAAPSDPAAAPVPPAPPPPAGRAALSPVTAGPVATAQAKTGANVAMPADVLATQQFLFAVYPDLMTRPVLIRLKPENGQVLVTLSDAPVSPADAGPGVPLITATVEFDAQGQLRRYTARGALLEQTRNNLLLAQVLTHPAWAESDLDAWLTAAGGATTVTGVAPTAAASLTTQPWRSYLGTNATPANAAFQWRPDKAPGAATKASTNAPAWVVNATATSAAGAPLAYRLEFEPFGGRLVAVTRQ